ncbi:MAG: formate dehydrogenase subunit gamma [Syntrophales bacterium]
MTTQIRKRTVGVLTLSMLLLFLASWMIYLQAGGADITNPRADFWRVVRQGVPAYTSTPQQGHTILINNGGENWREIRNGLLMRFSQWVPGLVLAAIALLYLLVGQDKLEKPRSGVTIERYTFGERFLHWYTAMVFTIMALTGLSLLLGRIALIPIFGYPVVSGYLQASKVLHNYCGPLLLVGIFLELVIWARYNIPKKIDLQWIISLGGMTGSRPRPHAEKINGGEKAWFWLVLLFGITVGITGVLLDFPIWGQTRFIMQVSHVIHATVAVLFVAASLGHIYMGTVGVEGAFGAMWTGFVDTAWAQQNHDLWYEEKVREQEKKSAEASPRHE